MNPFWKLIYKRQEERQTADFQQPPPVRGQREGAGGAEDEETLRSVKQHLRSSKIPIKPKRERIPRGMTQT